jgi:thiol:disulfide interchange protein DsbD
VPLTIGPDFKPSLFGSDVEIKLKAMWLVCHKECIPEEGEFALKVSAKSTTALNGAAFEASFAAAPQAFAGKSTVEVKGQTLHLSVDGLPATLVGKTLALFPETSDVVEPSAPITQAWVGSKWMAQLPLSPQRSKSPTTFPVVISTGTTHWRADAALVGAWPAVPGAAGVSPALQSALQSALDGNARQAQKAPPEQAPLSFIMALVGAFVGGLILNLMPCVFPVLAIKVFSFAKAASGPDALSARTALKAQGVAYAVGVVLCFVALGGLLLGLRAGGEQLGWGFQLQSPAIVAALAALFTLIALNLLGVFELGMLLPSSALTAQAAHPLLNAGLSGVLAVAVASPCTAPFMGASLGLAIGLPAMQALLVFACMGVGMALPYVLASFVPAVAAALPRPGAWMDVFKRFMAFPMLATVVWLMWVLGQQSGIDGAAALLALLLLMAMVAWALSLQGRSRLGLVSFTAAALLWAGITWWPTVVAPMAQADAAIASSTPGTANPGAPVWQAWQPGRVEQLQAEGKPVFVDFTAAWCVTCQYNKKTTLADAQVQADLAAKNITLLRADWTRRDPAITAALAQLGRNGVPVYVFYKAGRAPVVLSEILSVAEVRAAIAAL